MRVVQVNYQFDASLAAPEALLDRYTTLTGLSTALLDAGAGSVRVVQGFSRDAVLTRDGVEYVFRTTDVNKVAARSHPDIVHVNGLDSPQRTWWLRRALPSSARMVVQDHGSQVPTERGGRIERRLRRGARARAMRAPDAFFFTSADLAEPWRAAGLIGSRQRVYEVLEASTTLRPMDRGEARRISGVQGTPALLWVGRLNATKDPLAVLEGFERSLARVPGAELTMVYSADDLLPAIRERVAASPLLAPRVRYAGRVPHEHLTAFYSAADIFVLGSHREGSGYALIEACACGAVPVVTSIPAFRVITGSGEVGSLWTAGDPDAFAAALIGVAESDFAMARTRCVEHFHRTLSWPGVGRVVMEAYRDITSPAT